MERAAKLLMLVYSEKNYFAVPAQTADAFLVIQQRQKAGSFCCQP